MKMEQERIPGHVSWQPSIVHWVLLQRFWPCKLAALEARRLGQVV